jgi:transcriptional regulator with XRE-family HTH domain
MLDKTDKHTGLSRFGYPMRMPSAQLALIEMPKKENMGTRIRARREELSLTIEQVAAACGVSKSAVSQWELGESKNIKLYAFMRLKRLLDVTHEWLIFGPTEQPPDGFYLDEADE